MTFGEARILDICKKVSLKPYKNSLITLFMFLVRLLSPVETGKVKVP